MINEDHAVALKLCTREEYNFIKQETLKINELLKEFFLSLNLKLVDFKIEFGKTPDGQILLADEISPDLVVYGMLKLIKNTIKMYLDKILVI